MIKLTGMIRGNPSSTCRSISKAVVVSQCNLHVPINYKGLLFKCMGIHRSVYKLIIKNMNQKCLTLSSRYLFSTCVVYFGHFSVIPVGFRFAVLERNTLCDTLINAP